MHPAITANGKLALIVGPHAEREAMMEIVAALALRGPVRVLDGGNSYEAFRVTRLIRRRSHRLHQILGHIAVARAFTCYQVLTLLADTPAAPIPTIGLDLLRTFDDENVTPTESLRLVRQVIGHLHRLREAGPVAVGLRPSLQQEKSGLLEAMIETADRVTIRREPAVATPLTLF